MLPPGVGVPLGRVSPWGGLCVPMGRSLCPLPPSHFWGPPTLLCLGVGVGVMGTSPPCPHVPPPCPLLAPGGRFGTAVPSLSLLLSRCHLPAPGPPSILPPQKKCPHPSRCHLHVTSVSHGVSVPPRCPRVTSLSPRCHHLTSAPPSLWMVPSCFGVSVSPRCLHATSLSLQRHHPW